MKAISIQNLAENYINTKSDRDFKKLYDRLLPGIKKYAWSFLKDKYNANDMIDEVISISFSKVFVKIHQYNSNWNFSTWVYRIVRNECLTELNRQKKIRYLSQYVNEDNTAIDPATITGILNKEDFIYKDNFEDIENYLEQMELYSKTIETMNNLKDIHKNILIDRELNHMKYKDIAEKYDLPINTVKSRIRSARLKIKNKLS